MQNWGRTHKNTIRISGAMVNGRIRRDQERSEPDLPGVALNHRIRLSGTLSGGVERIHCPRPMAQRPFRYHELEITKSSSIIQIQPPKWCRCQQSKCPFRTTDSAPRDLVLGGQHFSTARSTRGRQQSKMVDRLRSPGRNMTDFGPFLPAWSPAPSYLADTLMLLRSHTLFESLP